MQVPKKRQKKTPNGPFGGPEIISSRTEERDGLL